MAGGRWRVAGGRMTVPRNDGSYLFNSDDKLFHPLSTVNGTVAMRAWTGGNGEYVHRTEVFNLGAVNPACTQVIGAVKFTLNNYAAGAAFDRWTMVMGGSIVWVLDGESGSPIGTNGDLFEMVTYHFDISGGQCRLVQHIAIDGSVTGFYTVRSHSIEFKLRCGIWV